MLRKRDLKDAFRKIRVSPYDYWLLIFEWDGQFYIDLALAFGMSTSPFIFNLFSEGLHWIIENKYNQSVARYLDDFLLVGYGDQNLFSQLCNKLGFEEKLSKAMDGYVVDFTGIELDSDKMEARLPQDKLTRAWSAVEQTLCQGSTSYKALNSLLGFLSFCTRVTPLGRPFLRQLFNFMQVLPTTHHNTKRRLTPEAKSDLRWWLVFLNNWSGIRVIRQHRRDLHVYMDASGVKGIGGWHGCNAFSIRMPRRHRAKHINWKEAYAILFSIAKWGGLMAGLQSHIHVRQFSYSRCPEENDNPGGCNRPPTTHLSRCRPLRHRSPILLAVIRGELDCRCPFAF